jgi:hypothetical protein
LPLLWREHVIGWANVSVLGQSLTIEAGYLAGNPPRDRGFRRAFADERARLSEFLGLA